MGKTNAWILGSGIGIIVGTVLVWNFTAKKWYHWLLMLMVVPSLFASILFAVVPKNKEEIEAEAKAKIDLENDKARVDCISSFGEWNNSTNTCTASQYKKA